MPTTVLTFYLAQRRLLRSLLVGLDAEVATVDGFHGRERERIILNLVARSPVKFVEDSKRLNVAVSRPSRSLNIVADVNFWKDQKQQAQAAIDQHLVTYEPFWPLFKSSG
jgi:superfamily I DNA and/or RNA helicase